MTRQVRQRVPAMVTPQAALDLIFPLVGTEVLAKEVIADGLRSGRVRCDAKFVWGSSTGDLRNEWLPRKHPSYIYGEDVELMPDFWRESQQWPTELAHWRWDNGEFVLFVSNIDEDRLHRTYLKGVVMDRRDILALVRRRTRAGVGGKTPDRERWAAFWTAVLFKATGDTFDWTQFDDPQELKAKLIEGSEDGWSDGVPSDCSWHANNFDNVLPVIWDGLVKRLTFQETNR
jgi:hypothetical protein